MTLAASTTQVSYIGNGAVNGFPFPFLVFTEDHLVVTVSAPSPSTTSYDLVLGTDYSVSGLSATGTIPLPGTVTVLPNGQAWMTGAFLSSGYTILIERVVPLDQPYSIRNQGDFYREFLENALDYMEMQIQQIQTEISNLGDQAAAIAALQAAILIIQNQLTPTSLILTDVVNGNKYMILMANGYISTEQV